MITLYVGVHTVDRYDLEIAVLTLKFPMGCFYVVLSTICIITSEVTTVTFKEGRSRPSKCPKFYTNRNLGEQNLRQKVRKFGQNLNRDIMTYLIKYTLTVQFSI